MDNKKYFRKWPGTQKWQDGMELSKAQRCTQDFDHAEGQMVGQDSFSFLVFHLKTDNKSKTVSIKTEKNSVST